MKKIKLVFSALIVLFLTFNGLSQTAIVKNSNPINIGAAISEPIPKAFGTYSELGSESTLTTNKGLVSAKLAGPCPVPIYDVSPSKTFNCNAVCSGSRNIVVRDSAVTSGAIGEWMQQAALLVVRTDGFNDTQNTLEVWSGATLVIRVGPTNTGTSGATPQAYFTWAGWFGSSMNNKTARVWLYGICSASQVKYVWFDSGNNAGQPWYVWDAATNTVKGSGTFSGGSTGITVGPYTNWGGSVTYSCPTCPAGALTQFCDGPAARFCANLAGVGKFGITYTWDNGLTGVDACKNSYTDTVEVLPIYTTTWTPPSSLCATSATVNLNTYLGGLTTPGGTWSSSTNPSSISGSTWNTSGLSGAISLTYTVGGGTGCESKESHTITVNPKPTVTASTTTPSFCSSGSISATLNAGGTASSYSWNTTQTGSPIVVSLSTTTTYTVTGTDAKSCTNTATVTVTVNPQPSLSLSKTDIKCNGDLTGTISSTAGSPGTSPYTYSWSSSQTTSNLVGVAAGNYTLTVTDVKGCTKTSTTTLTQPSSALSLPNPTSTNTGCGTPTGTASISGVTGGTPSYSYAWTGGKTGANITGLSAGTYTLTVTDANNCTATKSVTVSSTTAGPAVNLVSKKDVNCYGQATGNIFVSAGGSVTYSWSTGGANDNVTNLTAGTYTVTVTNTVNSCPTVETYTIGGPNPYDMGNNIVSNLNCKGDNSGKLNITPTGNNQPYTFDWLPGSKTTEDLTGLAAGSYSLVITDAKGCTGAFTYTITEPTAISATTTPVDAACGLSNGSATVNPSGGTPTYSYLWNNNATGQTASNLASGAYTVTVSDSKGCTGTATVTINNPNSPNVTILNSTPAGCGKTDGTATASGSAGTGPYTYSWSNSSTGSLVSNLGAGTYVVTVTDSKNCNSTASVTITNPNAPTATSTSTAASCGQNDGTATVSGSPVSTYTYLWSPGGGTTATINNLAGGTYTVTISDANGCSATTTAVVTPSPKPTANFTPSVLVGGAPLDVTFTNTSSGATIYYWSFGDGQVDLINQNPSHIYTIDGKYNSCLVAKSASGCLDSLCRTIEVISDTISIPNVFTPNGDNINDVFVIFARGFQNLEVSIFDRWGLKMWSSSGTTSAWDGKNTNGKECPSGTYYYIVKATKYDSTIKEFSGFLTLIRQ